MAKNTICLWYDKDAEAAARFYAKTFPNSAVGAVHRAPSDYPAGKSGDVLTVEFTVAGVSCIGLNGGPTFKHNEAFSFQIATEDQEETDRYWKSRVYAMVKKLELSEGCSRCAPMTVASPIAAATRAYSIAVKPASAARKFRGAAIAQIDLRHGGTGMVVTPALVNSSLQISMKCLAVQTGNLEDFWR